MDNTSVVNLIKMFQESNDTYGKIMQILRENNYQNKDIIVNHIKNLMTSIFCIEDEVIQYRLKKILNEKHPFIPTIDPNSVANKNNSPNTIFDIFQKFISQRMELLQILTSIPNDAWERTGVHATEGHLPFYEFVRRMIEKDSGNISQLKSRIPLN